jgi:O-antigen ligase
MNRISNLKNFFFILLGFSIPISVAFTNILIVAYSLTWIFEGDFPKKIKEIKSVKWISSLLLLISFYFLGMLYGDMHNDYSYVIKRVLLLLFFIPIVISELKPKTYILALHAFLISNLTSALVAVGINYDFINPIFDNSAITAFLKYNYHNILLSFSALLSFLMFLKSKSKYSFLYIVLILIYSFSIFNEAGRAGQLTFNVFFVCYAIFLLRSQFKFSILIILFLIIINFFSYKNSSIFKHRVDHLTHIVQNDGQKKNKNSVEKDIRYLFTKTGLELIRKKPIFGYGTGSFSSVFKLETETSYDLNKHKTPHNNYLYILFELGFIGLIFFLSIFYFQIKELLNKDLINTEKILLPLFMLFLMLFDSYMFIFSITLFYIFMYKIFTKLDFKQ